MKESVTNFIIKIYWSHEEGVTNFITKIHCKRLLTSLQKSVTKFIPKSYWLHHKKKLQNSLQKVTDFTTKKCCKIHYTKLLTS